MASISYRYTFPTKNQFSLTLPQGAVSEITCTKRGLYKFVAVGGDGGYARQYSDQEGTSVYPGISASGGAGGTCVVYRIVERGEKIYYVGGGSGGLTSSIGGDYPYGKDGEAGFNGGHSGKYRGEVTSGASGGMSYFMTTSPKTVDEIKSSSNIQYYLNQMYGIAGGGGGGKGILGVKSGNPSSYKSGLGGAGGGASGLGRWAGKTDVDDYLPQTTTSFSPENFGNGDNAISTWGGYGGAGYIAGDTSNNYGGNGGTGWINPAYASVTAKGQVWRSFMQQGHTQSAGIYWEKNWITPLVYYGDREVDSLYVGDRDVDTIYFGDREIGS